ncbi:MAG: T9SS type A sorting domain-containing protein [Bacteroidia bacterium]|nr:T9SS type A sorting domain-containing protein [Bacteroidia bacterium]
MTAPTTVYGVVLLDNVEVLYNEMFTIQATPSNVTPCFGEDYTITYNICLTPNTPAPTSDVVLNFATPTGVAINQTSSCDFDISGNAVIHPNEWNGNNCIHKTICLSVTAISLPGQAIHHTLITNPCSVSSDVLITPGYPVLTINKEAIVCGNHVTYNITVENNSDIIQTNATDIIITDELPPLLTNFQSIHFYLTSGTNTITLINPLSLMPGHSETRSFTLDIPGNVPANTMIMNCATVEHADGVCGLPIESCINFYVTTQPLAITNQISYNCNNANLNSINITVTGGAPPYTFFWSNGATTEDLINIGSATYTVTVTDACNTTITSTINVQPVTPLTLTKVMTNIPCAGGSTGAIDLTVSGGIAPYTYLWSNGATIQDVSGLAAGTYTVSVTDANACTATATFTIITLYPQPSVSITTNPSNLSLCLNQTSAFMLTATASNLYNPSGPPPLFQWSNGSTMPNITVTVSPVNTQPVSYTVTVTDPTTGCTNTQTISIPVIAPPTIDIQTPSCMATTQPMSLTAVLSSPDPSATYTWNFGDGSPTQTSYLFPAIHTFNYDGYYCINVISHGVCTASANQTIYLLPSPCACPANQNYNDIINPALLNISSNTTWPPTGFTTLYINGTVSVNPNSTLTINENMIIHFGPQGKIIVDKNGVLFLKKNSKLTNISSNCNGMWQGVEVWGDGTSNTANQGKIIMETNATIEKAHIGVLLGKRRKITDICNFNILNAFQPEYGGGIIVANSSNFNMNGIAVKFANKTVTSVTPGSSIVNCTINGGNLTAMDPGYQKTSGVPYYPNRRNPWAGAANHLGISPDGIYIQNNRGLVIDGGSQTSQYNHFSNTFAGIESYNGACGITNNYFDRHWYGIFISNSTYSMYQYNKITKNFFTNIPGNSTALKPFSSAIYLNVGYKDLIKNNYFGEPVSQNKPQTWNLTGITTINSRKLSIMDNHFWRNKWGIRISGNDQNSTDNNVIGWSAPPGNEFLQTYQNVNATGNNKKLQIRCGKSIHSSIFNDPEYNTNWYINSPLYYFQGSYQNPAGNQYSPSDKKHIQNAISQYFAYYYNLDGGPFIPTTVGNIAPNPGNTYFNNGAQCPTTTFALSQYPGLINQVSTSITQLNAEFQQVLSGLDHGQTVALLNAINTNSNGVLQNKLINASPLTDDVVRAVINKPNPLPPGNFKNVMERNLPVSDTVYPDFKTKLATLPNGIKNQLTALQSNNPGYRTLTSVSRDLIAIQDEYTRLTSDYINELVNQGMTSQALAFLKTDNSYPAASLLIGTYSTLDSISIARNTLASFTPATQDEADWKAIQSLLLYYSDSGRTIYDIDTTQLAFVRNLALQDPPSQAASQAWTILGILYGEKYSVSIDTVATGASARFSHSDDSFGNIEELEKPLDFNLYPNPAAKEIIVEYPADETQDALLEIYDILGKKQNVYKLDGKANLLKISVEEFASGIYYFRYIVNGETLYQNKLVISK